MIDAGDYFEFVYLTPFRRAAKGVVTEDDLQAIELAIIGNPNVGATVGETGGVRKMRYAREGAGKSGGLRIIYYHRGAKGRVYMITLYPKNRKEDLTRAECHAIKKLVEAIEREP